MRQGWEVTNIGSIADITDYVANGSFATLRENVSYLNDKGYAILVRLADYTNNFDKSKFVYIDEHAYDFLSKSKLVGGEIIMSNVGSIGKSFICPDLGMPMSLAPNSIVIKTPNNPFYHYLFQSDYFQTALRTISSQTALPKFNKTSFKKIIVPVPPIAEQEKIVAELDCLSGIIEKKKQQLKELDNLAQSIFYEMFGNPVENDKGWEQKTIGSFSKCVAGATPSTKVKEYWNGGTIPWLSSGEVGNGRIYATEKHITQEGYDNASTKLIPPHTVVMALAGQGKTRGTVGVAEIPLCTNQSICSIITNDGVNVDFLYYQLRYLYHELRDISNGDGGRGGLNLKLIQGFKVLVPPFDLQQEFASKIQSIEKQKELIALSIKETETLFNSRMDYYFN